jgi:hypothetical protein
MKYLNPSIYDHQRWQELGNCTHCGSQPESTGNCFCRKCTSCSETWLAPTRAPMRDTDHGPLPAEEYCGDCLNSKCGECELPASHDVHDGHGAGRHGFKEAA